jgi:putative ABC transport system permease protein
VPTPGVFTAVGFVTGRRLARQWPAIVAGGVVLGITFGLCLASLAAARRTASAYDRVLAAADAPDAAVSIGEASPSALRSLAAIDGVTRTRAYAGFLGSAVGYDRALATALIAPVQEAIVNTGTAASGNLEVGQHLDFELFDPIDGATTRARVEIVGIGTVPSEPVSDETSTLGLFVFSRGFYDAHRDFAMYAVANVDLAPGFDARRDLAPAIGALGYQLQSARSQERALVNDALRPLVIVLVAIGVLAFGAALVATVQIVVRTRDRWRSDTVRLRSLGVTRVQLLVIELASNAVLAGVAATVALVAMVLASPVAPIGPLHELDPGQGFGLDLTVAVLGVLVVVVTILIVTAASSSARVRTLRPAVRRAPWFTALPGSPVTTAGLSLALRTEEGRTRGWRAAAATTVATTGLALCGAFVVSALALIETPASYGFDADVLALNAYGDQSQDDLQRIFGARDDVVAATAFTTGSFLVDGRAVPGLAATAVKDELVPTVLRGRAPRAGDEIVVGADTLEDIGADVGDVVPVRLLDVSLDRRPGTGRTEGLRIVGVVTFPPVAQIGTDMPRLGVGVLVTREAFLRMGGLPANQPELTIARITGGTDPATVIAANPEGFQDLARTATVWFTDARPAELRQLDAARSYLVGALVVGFVILVAVFVHALWTRVQANRRDLAVLQVIGCTSGQRDAITAWQAAPFVVGSAALGVPLGLLLGRVVYRWFAQSLAVVADETISPALVGALVVAVIVAAVVASAVAMLGVRRSRAAVILRET